MQLLLILLLHLLCDTLVLFVLLRLALRDNAPKSKPLLLVCLGIGVWKFLLFLVLGVAAIVPFLLSLGPFLGWAYSLGPRKILYILATFLVIGIAVGSILRMAHGVLELFFI